MRQLLVNFGRLLKLIDAPFNWAFYVAEAFLCGHESRIKEHRNEVFRRIEEARVRDMELGNEVLRRAEEAEVRDKIRAARLKKHVKHQEEFASSSF
jgi:hypothetical protein